MRLGLGIAGVAALALMSLGIGVGPMDWRGLFTGTEDGQTLQLLLASRIPRTVAIVLAGMTLGVAGLIMQLLARNRFAEPSTAGTAESASLGLLAAMVLAPAAPIFVKMLIASGFALTGTAVFLGLLRRIPRHSVLMVPLVGLMLGGIIESVTTFFAYRLDLLQSVNAWTAGDFSGVLEGRYELLWLAAALAVAAYLMADRLTLAGMGEDFAANLGVDHRRIMVLGLIVVAMVTAVVVVTVGMVPFLGLIVPNLVAMAIGDNARRGIPWVALSGAALLLACDMLGRLVRYPYEIPVGLIVGVIGGAAFLALMLRRQARFG